MKFRIIERVVDGKTTFYQQARRFFFWRTIRTSYQKVAGSRGGFQTQYTAEMWIENYKKSLVAPVIIPYP